MARVLLSFSVEHFLLDPEDCSDTYFFSHGGIVLLVLAVIYFCMVVTSLCDNYLLQGLEALTVKLNLSEDLAGILLAIGGSLPELMVNVFGTIDGTQIGVGTVIGSAVFNLTFALCVVCLCSPAGTFVRFGPLLRDCAVYSVALLMVLFFRYDGAVTLPDSAALVVLYAVFIVVAFATRSCFPLPAKTQPELPQEGEASAADAVTCPSSPLTPEDYPRSDEEFSRGERTRSVTCGPSVVIGDEDSGDDSSLTDALLPRSPSSPSSPMERGNSEYHVYHRSSISKNKGEAAQEGIKKSCSTRLYSALWRVVHIILTPTDWLFRHTIPDCRPAHRRHLFPATLFVSFLYVFVLSFLVMRVVEFIGCISGMDDAFAGLIFLSIGASLPDAITMAVAAHRGHGAMSVAGLINSNTFDLLMGLGLPWFLFNLFHGGKVIISSMHVLKGVYFTFGAVFLMLISLMFTGYQLKKTTCILPMILYVAYFVVELL